MLGSFLQVCNEASIYQKNANMIYKYNFAQVLKVRNFSIKLAFTASYVHFLIVHQRQKDISFPQQIGVSEPFFFI